MALILRADSSMTAPDPGTPILEIPEFIPDPILDWDARDLPLGEFTEWVDRVEGTVITEKPTQDSASVVTVGGRKGVRLAGTTLGATRALSGDVTKVVVFRPEAGTGSSARVITAGTPNYRSIQISSLGQYFAFSSTSGGYTPGFADAPGALGVVQAHAAAWEGGTTVRAVRDGGDLAEAQVDVPTSDSSDMRIGGQASVSPSAASLLFGVVHRVLVYGRALSGAEMTNLTDYLAGEWS